MFEFLNMLNDYEDRRVGKHEADGLFISTALVRDGDKLFETAVEHPEYNNGTMIIVEAYDTREDAAKGHERWIATMTSEPLPRHLQDCQNSTISKFLDPSELCFIRKGLDRD